MPNHTMLETLEPMALSAPSLRKLFLMLVFTGVYKTSR